MCPHACKLIFGTIKSQLFQMRTHYQRSCGLTPCLRGTIKDVDETNILGYGEKIDNAVTMFEGRLVFVTDNPSKAISMWLKLWLHEVMYVTGWN